MVEKYPVFTNGKMFFHSHGEFPKNCRFAYFSDQDLKTWNKKEGKNLKPSKAIQRAKEIYENWDKSEGAVRRVEVG